MKLAEYMDNFIFKPLGMTDTSFKLTEEKEKRLSAQYIYTQEKGLSPLCGCIYRLSENYESGGAGLASTVKDLSLFVDALTNKGIGMSGKRILEEKTIRLMQTEQLSKFAKDTTFACSTGEGYGYGLGVRTLIDKSQGQKSAIGEFGWDGAAGSFLLADPENKLSIAYTMHIRSWPLMLGFGHAPLRDVIYEALDL
jgi:CubicO group peptidase (beta-lactamase class C family)